MLFSVYVRVFVRKQDVHNFHENFKSLPLSPLNNSKLLILRPKYLCVWGFSTKNIIESHYTVPMVSSVSHVLLMCDQPFHLMRNCCSVSSVSKVRLGSPFIFTVQCIVHSPVAPTLPEKIILD